MSIALEYMVRPTGINPVGRTFFWRLNHHKMKNYIIPILILLIVTPGTAVIAEETDIILDDFTVDLDAAVIYSRLGQKMDDIHDFSEQDFADEINLRNSFGFRLGSQIIYRSLLGLEGEYGFFLASDDFIESGSETYRGEEGEHTYNWELKYDHLLVLQTARVYFTIQPLSIFLPDLESFNLTLRGGPGYFAGEWVEKGQRMYRHEEGELHEEEEWEDRMDLGGEYGLNLGTRLEYVPTSQLLIRAGLDYRLLTLNEIDFSGYEGTLGLSIRF